MAEDTRPLLVDDAIKFLEQHRGQQMFVEVGQGSGSRVPVYNIEVDKSYDGRAFQVVVVIRDY